MTTLYLTDLDGTLLNSSARLSDFSRQALEQLIRRGMLFSYATARSVYSAQRALSGFLPGCPAVVYNGAMLIEPESMKILHLERFSDSEIRSIREILQAHGLRPLVYGFVEDKERVSYIQGPAHPGVKHYLASRAGDRRLRPVDAEDRLYQGAPFYFTIIGDKAELEGAHQALCRMDLGRVTFQQEIYRSEYWLEIMPHGATKAHGLQRLKALTHADRVICFGDAINDIPLFEAADAAYAVENAHPSLKQIARSVLPSNDEDGVARFLLEHYKGEQS